MELYKLTIHEAVEKLKNKEITSKQLTTSILERIENVEEKIDAYISIDKEGALKQAELADKAIEEGKIGPLTGIPLSIKDLICTEGTRTTCASKILENFVPTYDATVITKLKEAGAIIVGKVNMDEFAMGSTNENSGFKSTKNPWDINCIPGGSSGGSAASVSAEMCLGSLGSDTGGSIRQPASHCGIVGMKPTYGRVSRFGLVAFASSLDQIGPLTKNVHDCAIMMNAISGYDENDSTSVPKEVPDYTEALVGDIKGLKIGIPKEYFDVEGMDNDVKKAIENAIETYKKAGADFIDISLPHSKYAVAAYYVIAPSEASSNLARYDGVRYGVRSKNHDNLLGMYEQSRSEGLGLEVQRRIIIGTYALSSGYYDAYYKKASQVRTLIMNDFKTAFEKCDIILSPVTPEPATALGENKEDPLKMYLSDIFTLSANLAGIPGMSIPCGFSGSGKPIGLQLMGKHFDEATLLKAAYNFEKMTDFHKKRPEL